MSDQNRTTPMKTPLRIEDSNGVTVYQIRSVTVKWSDLGIDIEDHDHCRAVKRRQYEILDWLDQKCHRYELKANGVWFLDPDDAMLFKLTWAGVIT
jgi:hypothetical protein